MYHGLCIGGRHAAAVARRAASAGSVPPGMRLPPLAPLGAPAGAPAPMPSATGRLGLGPTLPPNPSPLPHGYRELSKDPLPGRSPTPGLGPRTAPAARAQAAVAPAVVTSGTRADLAWNTAPPARPTPGVSLRAMAQAALAAGPAEPYSEPSRRARAPPPAAALPGVASHPPASFMDSLSAPMVRPLGTRYHYNILIGHGMKMVPGLRQRVLLLLSALPCLAICVVPADHCVPRSKLADHVGSLVMPAVHPLGMPDGLKMAGKMLATGFWHETGQLSFSPIPQCAVSARKQCA